MHTWYPGGPSLSTLPLPVPDTERPLGCKSCSSGKDFCSGHYQSKCVDVTDSRALSVVPKPPLAVLKKLFSNVNGTINNDMLESVAKEVLLPTEECRIWMKHLMTVLETRCHGDRKATETRKNHSRNAPPPSHVSSQPGEGGSEAQVDESE